MKTFSQFCENLDSLEKIRKSDYSRRTTFQDSVKRAEKQSRLKRIRAKLAAAGINDDEGDFADKHED